MVNPQTPSPTPQDELRGRVIATICTLWGRNFDEMLSSQRVPINLCADKMLELITSYGDQRAQKAHEDGYREGELSGAKGSHNYIFNHFELLPKINNLKVGRGTTHSSIFTEVNYQHAACQYTEMIEDELNAKREKS